MESNIMFGVLEDVILGKLISIQCNHSKNPRLFYGN